MKALNRCPFRTRHLLATEHAAPQDSNLDSESQVLTCELYGGAQISSASSSWNNIKLSSIQAESRSGMSKEARTRLLSKFEPKGDLSVNPVTKRNEYQTLLPAQIGACLNDLDSGISILLNKTESALTFFAEGIHLLSDHRLSLNKRTFNKSSLNIIGKNTTDTASIDEFLFGQNFAETLKAAQVCGKTGREFSKSTVQTGKNLYSQFEKDYDNKINLGCPDYRYRKTRRVPASPSAACWMGASYRSSRYRRSHSRHCH
ncbi:hypothetical protein ALC57_18813 [Trachymyrmex cornetzi]|uniref:Uncharacterized protein n=1 Tax=Trachymyrmex cornetzi TaxID=471704 RepID=A0A151IR85_9HYME|nr:hypothetical protein ALC57_18813 [Trachymyrmex cornetzi]